RQHRRPDLREHRRGVGEGVRARERERLRGGEVDGAVLVPGGNVGGAQQGNQQRRLVEVVAGSFGERLRRALLHPVVVVVANLVVDVVEEGHRLVAERGGERGDFSRLVRLGGVGEVIGRRRGQHSEQRQ